MFSILCMHFFIAYRYIAKLELSMWINVFWLLNQISVDIIWRTPFHNFTALYKFNVNSFISIHTKTINWCMSSWEWLEYWRVVRILALLKRKTLNGALKCLKRHYSTVRSVKNVAVLTEEWAFAVFFRPRPGDLTAQESPPPGICHPWKKKCQCPGFSPGGLGTAGIDWCLSDE